ncbi:DNA-binding transcriptional regulator Fis [soil metagenome]
MAKKPTSRRKTDKPPVQEPPLRDLTQRALATYFHNLNGHKPSELYDLVMREVEQPLFEAVLEFTAGNQCRAAEILGINRGTLRKKLRNHHLLD